MLSLRSMVRRIASLASIIISFGVASTRRSTAGGRLGILEEVGDEQLALPVGGPPAGGPHQPAAVGAEGGQAVEPLAVGDPLLGAVVDVHQVELVILMAVPAGRVDDVAAVGVPVRPPVDEG